MNLYSSSFRIPTHAEALAVRCKWSCDSYLFNICQNCQHNRPTETTAAQKRFLLEWFALCMPVHACACLRVSAYVNEYMSACISLCQRIYVCMYLPMSTNICLRVSVYVNEYMSACICLCQRIYVCVSMSMNICLRVSVHNLFLKTPGAALIL